MSDSFARSSVSSAVISFVVEPIGRRLSAWRWQATMPVETSITIACGALTELGQAVAWALAGIPASSPAAAMTASRARFTRSA